jgi:hypothetical protein
MLSAEQVLRLAEAECMAAFAFKPKELSSGAQNFKNWSFKLATKPWSWQMHGT